MTKTEALYNFFSGFGIDAYPSNAVPDDVTFPWLTYEPTIADTWQQISSTVNLWYHTDSEAAPNAKAEQISKALGLGGAMVACEDGVIWIKRGNPWCTAINDDNDTALKRRYLNVTLEYLTF